MTEYLEDERHRRFSPGQEEALCGLLDASTSKQMTENLKAEGSVRGRGKENMGKSVRWDLIS